MQDTIDDIKSLMENAKGDLSPADFVELSMVAIANIRQMADKAQEEIDGEEVCASAINRLGSDMFTSAMGMTETIEAFEDLEMSKRGF